MCGISGYFSKTQAVKLDMFYNAHKKLAHRGPDDEGFICKTEAGLEFLYGDDTINEKRNCKSISSIGFTPLILGHRRLSIIDLSPAGHQPFCYEELSLVYNGEIFNYIELRSELSQLGYEFKTGTDTEVFLKAYHCWGVEAFNKFNGMWAAALYDSNSGKLLLTRDRFGIKPLYYHYNKETKSLIFGSEIKFVLPFLNRKKLDEKSVYSYLRYSYLNHNERTFFEGILSLKEGSYLSFGDDGHSIDTYYDLVPKKGDISALMHSSVKLRMRTDTELGILLSGGIDSSTLSSVLLDKTEQRVNSFTADFDDKRFSEKEFVDEILEKSNLEGHFIKFAASDIERDLDDLLLTHECPVRSLSAYLQYKIFQYVKENTNVKVTFGGQGADEVFSGYTNDHFIYLASLITKGKIKTFIHEFNHLKANKDLSSLHILKKVATYLLRPMFKRDDPYGIFSKDCIDHSPVTKSSSLFKSHQLFNFKVSALKEFFRSEDRNSMRFSIESRLPFMDYRLVEAGLALDEKDMIFNGTSKYRLREFATGRVPNRILNRKDKMGFVTPQEVWQKDELVPIIDSTFSNIHQYKQLQFIDSDKIMKIYSDYKQGKFNDWAFIWRYFCLVHFCRVWGVEE